MGELGLYIHIPFCTTRCSYCDFYSASADEETKDSYLNAVLSYLESSPYGGRKVDSLYFGGGTPTTFGGDRLAAIVEKVDQHFQLDRRGEIALEANPESTSLPLLRQLKGIGWNRISFGIQSLIPKELKALGRCHTKETGIQRILEAEQAGFSHISADVMLGIPYQTEETLTTTLQELSALPLDHLSAYLLAVEEGTPLATSELLGELPSEEETCGWYLLAVELLQKQGFAQYETSNFAKPGGISRHNLKYWELEEYLGIGPSAHSYIEGLRFAFPANRDTFIRQGGNWQDLEDEGLGGDWEEYAMLRLRLVPGLDLQKAKEEYPEVDFHSIREKAKKLQGKGYLTLQDEVITFTPQGFLLSLPLTGELLY